MGVPKKSLELLAEERLTFSNVPMGTCPPVPSIQIEFEELPNAVMVRFRKLGAVVQIPGFALM
jgi:hypothetical protein